MNSGWVLKKLVPGMIVAPLVVALWALGGFGQDRTAGPPEKGTATLKIKYYGYRTCAATCHALKEPAEPGKYVCRCTEVGTWLTDKHHDAMKALEGDRARQMEKLLNIKAAAERACVRCHGIDDPDKSHFDKSFRDALDEGVTCMVCHGPYGEWVEKHRPVGESVQEEWRKLPRGDKERQYGMKDLWDPETRTQVCASCHVGNAAAGKFVTHEMYAAGHPPLPSFALAAFSEQMPRHWQYIGKKSDEIQKVLGFRPGSQTFEKTKLVAVSGVMTLAETMRLLAEQAKQCASPKDGGESGLDFANFDCYACHHDLKTPSWRQQRGYVGKPGRPPMRPWATALAGIVIGVARPKVDGQKLDDGLRELRQAFGARPYGDGAAIAATAAKLADQLTAIGKALNREETPRFGAWAPKLVDGLVSVQETPDYDSARQIAWALEIILQDTGKAKAPQVAQVLTALKQNLKLELPAGKDRSIERELGESLRTLNDYNPDDFKRELKKLAELLPKEK